MVKDINYLFKVVMSFLITCFIIGLLCDPLGSQLNVFFLKTDNLLADFYNIMIWIADKDPYYNTYGAAAAKSYFPLSYLILMIFSGFENYSGLCLKEVYSSTTATISCMIYTLGSIFLYFHSLTRIVKCNTYTLLIISLSSVFLFTIERGNLIMIAAAFSFYFLAYKDSNSFWLRRFSLFSLCVASVLKIYPVVLGLFLLKDKRYKDVVICVVLSLLLIFIPFVAFERGFNNIPKFIDNVIEAGVSSEFNESPRYGLFVLSVIGCRFLGILDSSFFYVISILTKLMVWFFSGLSIFFFFYEKEFWKRLALITMLIVYLPQVNFFYCGIYFMPFILLFLSENPKWTHQNLIYMLLICIFLNPFQILFHGWTISWMLSNVAMMLFWLLLLVNVYWSWRDDCKKRTKTSNELM